MGKAGRRRGVDDLSEDHHAALQAGHGGRGAYGQEMNMLMDVKKDSCTILLSAVFSIP